VDDILLIGVGNPDRGDDCAGLEVVRRLEALRPPGVRLARCSGDALELMDLWRGFRRVVVVDAALGGGHPGAVNRFRVGTGRLPWYLRSGSTHSWGVAEAVEMARALGELPEEVVVYAIEGRYFGLHRGLCPEVRAAAAEVAQRVIREAEQSRAARSDGGPGQARSGALSSCEG
jgi:hydrogenase maturation protease